MTEPKRASILVVDDETAVRELLKLQLAGAGYDVLVATTPSSPAAPL